MVLIIAPLNENLALRPLIRVVCMLLMISRSNRGVVGITAVRHHRDGIVVEVLAVRWRPGEELVKSKAFVFTCQLNRGSSHMDMRPENMN